MNVGMTSMEEQRIPECERKNPEEPEASRAVPDRWGTLRVALDWEVDYIDPPASFGGWNTGRVAQQMFESLVEDDLEDEGSQCTQLVPALAES